MTAEPPNSTSPFPPLFVSFKAAFQRSLEAIEGSVYSSLFDDIFPSSESCEDGGKGFANISSWYGVTWRSRNNSTSSDPQDLTAMCKDYQKECLLNTNWTVVYEWFRKNEYDNDLARFCPQPTTATAAPAAPTSSGLTSAMSEYVPPVYTSKALDPSRPNGTLGQDSTAFSSMPLHPHWSTASHRGDFPSHPESMPTTENADNSLKYLALLSLLLPILIIVAVIVGRFLWRRKKEQKETDKPKRDGFCMSGTLGSDHGLHSFPSTPNSGTNLVWPDAEEMKKQKTKRRFRNKVVPRQQSLDSNSSQVYFIKMEDSGQDSPPCKGEETVDMANDPIKQKMKQEWDNKLLKVDEMLNSNGSFGMAVEIPGQADC